MYVLAVVLAFELMLYTFLDSNSIVLAVSKKDQNYEATRLHFENLAKRYGNPIIILNLIKVIAYTSFKVSQFIFCITIFITSWLQSYLVSTLLQFLNNKIS